MKTKKLIKKEREMGYICPVCKKVFNKEEWNTHLKEEHGGKANRIVQTILYLLKNGYTNNLNLLIELELSKERDL